MTIISSNKCCLKCGKRKILKKFCIFCFQNTVTNHYVCIKETINIHDSYKARKGKSGFKKFVYEIISGWYPSGDKKIQNGVLKTRIIDKENNDYFEKVQDYTTRKVLRNCSEKLSEHKK